MRQPGSPLYNIEAEQALLGAILVNNEVYGKVSGYLEPGHFFEAVHARIYEAAAAVIRDGRIANPVTLKTAFENDPALKEIGGVVYLARLAGEAITIVAADSYGQVIRDLYVRRRILEEAERAISEIEQLPIDAQGAGYAADMAQRVSELASDAGARKSRFSMGESVTALVDKVATAWQHDGRRPDALLTHIKPLDDHTGGFTLGDLVIIAGRPSMGKTALAVELSRYAVANGNPAIFFSGEMSKEKLIARVVSASITTHSISYQRLLAGRFSEAEWTPIVETARAIQERPLTVVDIDRLTVPGIRAEIARAKAARPDLRLAVVDYIGLVQGDKARTRTEEVGAITAELKRIARQFNVVVVALAQLSRAVDGREGNRPRLSDLRESGSIEQDADIVIFPFREEYYLARSEPKPNTDEHFKWQTAMHAAHGVMELIIDKFRDGATGVVRAQFDMALNRITAEPVPQTEMF